MPDYTLLNVRETENMAERFGLAPDLEAHFPSRSLGLQSSGLSLQRLSPNARQPFGHRHREQEELFVLLDGSARVMLDDELVELRPFDALRVAPPVMRCFEAGPDGAEFLAFGAPAVSPPTGDTEVVQGWWGGQAVPSG